MNINASTSGRIILYAATNGAATSQNPIVLAGPEGERVVLLSASANATNTINNNNNNAGPSPPHPLDTQLNTTSSESDHFYYCKSSAHFEAGSSPFGKNDHSDPGYHHPWQWAEGAQAVQLASSPDRNIFGSRPFGSPVSSPCRSSPNIFSPPPLGAQLAKRFENFDHSRVHSSANSSAKRGRPSQEEISELILTGSSSKSGIKCDVCHRIFPREKSLQAHLRTHTGERPYRCTYKDCNRAFAQSGQLRTHQRLHTGEKPFICRKDGCSNRFTHPNRKCILHPNAGLRRILPALPPANSATKATVGKSVESANHGNSKATPKMALKQQQSGAVRKATTVNVSKPVLGNITSSVVNSPSKQKASTTSPSLEASPATLLAVGARQAPVVARKSVIVGRASRKLELEMNAVASAPAALSPPPLMTPIGTSALSNSRTEEQVQPVATNGSAQSSPERNRMDILGALALLEMAGVYKSSAAVEEALHGNENLAPNDPYEEEDSENRAPRQRRSPVKGGGHHHGSPRKIRAVLGVHNH